MIRHYQILFIFFLVVVSFHFFEAQFLSKFFLVYLPFLFVSFAIVLSAPFFFIKRVGFVLPVQLLVVSMLVSIFMAYISWDQSFMDSMLVTIPMMLWMFFFYLVNKEIPVHTIEKIILVYGVFYIVLFLYQLTHSQTVLFGMKDEFLQERGTTRIIIAGQGIFFLASFMALNKSTTQKSGRWFWILLSISGLVIPVLQATRQFIVGVLIIYLFHFTKNLSFFRKVIIYAFLVGLMIFYFKNSNNAIISGLIEEQEKTFQQGGDYIRVLSAAYFLTELSPSFINVIFGNGVPFGLNSSYTNFIVSLKQIGFYMSDVGIISIYAMFGIIAIFAYILIWIKSFTLSLPKDYYFLKYYLWFLLITSLTSDTTYSYDYLISTIFVLYIYHSHHLDLTNRGNQSLA